MLITELNATETSLHHFVAEASELGNHGFGAMVSTNLGNKQPFILTAVNRVDGELVSKDYKQDMGCLRLTIFND